MGPSLAHVSAGISPLSGLVICVQPSLHAYKMKPWENPVVLSLRQILLMRELGVLKDESLGNIVRQ
jgi:hypothetical protein